MSKQQMYLSQIIGEEYKSWQKGDVIIFNSPTGTGKTSVCLLLAQNLEPGEKILYIASRIAKVEEFKRDTCDFEQSFLYTTYQKLEQDISYLNYLTLNKYTHCKYIFIDECHYFTEDIAMPDSNASLSEEWLRTVPISPIKIYASATADTFYNILRRQIAIPDDHIYTIDKDYSYVKECLVYRKEEAIDIINGILANDPRDKILFFVNNTNRMEELHSQFGPEIADYLCSSNSTDTLLRKLCNVTNDQFSSLSMEKRILFATKTIDIGVNIKDENLRYIFCEMQDPSTIIQCLGRKRPMNESDYCNFYICNQDAKTMVLHYNAVKKHVAVYEDYKLSPELFIAKHQFDRSLNKGGSVFILTPGSADVKVDIMKVRKYKFDMRFYESVKENGFIETLKLFMDDYLAKIIRVYISKEDEVISFLRTLENRMIYKEDKQVISNYFSSIIKGKRTFGINVINEWLDDNLGDRYDKRFYGQKNYTRGVNYKASYWVLR